MHKKCPHCDEESFGWRELITLDCFSDHQCKNCHEPVRNSGWRQLLGPLVFISIVLATMPLWQYIPGEKSVLLIPLAAIVFAMAIVLAAKPVKAEARRTDPSAFIPDADNDKMILIRGWNEVELRQLLADFIEEDLAAFAAFRIEVMPRLETFFELSFPEDIHPAEFLSLISYLAYPSNVDPAGRSIMVAGKTTLNSDFDGLLKSFEGRKVVLYLPENDAEHDVVYLQAESGETLAKSISEGAWHKVKEPRLPGAVESLIW